MNTNINKLYECMAAKKVNNSIAREAIYTLLMQESDCLSVTDIVLKLKTTHHRKVSLNTIYRHLTFFTECGLVMIIQDDLKKAYYCLVDEEAKVFRLCPKCKSVSKMLHKQSMDEMLNTLENTEFITIHQRCKGCK